MKNFMSKKSRGKGFRSVFSREKSLRYCTRSPAKGLVRISSSTRDYSGYLVNVSQEGLMFKSRELPDEDERIMVSFRLIPPGHKYKIRGVVVWTAPMAKPDYYKSMGVRFIDPGVKERKRLKNYVKKFAISA